MKTKMWRSDNPDSVKNPIADTRTLAESVKCIVECEVGWGGSVEAMAKNGAVTFKTPILGHWDYSEWTPENEEERAALALIAAVTMKARCKADAGIDSIAERVINMTGGNPLLVTMVSGLVYGSDVRKHIPEALFELFKDKPEIVQHIKTAMEKKEVVQ